MHLVYIDEVKFNPPEEQFYWLFGLAIPEGEIQSIESALHAIAAEFFGKASPDQNTEFHAIDIIQGKGACKGRDMSLRVELFKKLTDAISSHPKVGRIVVRLEPALMSRTDLHHIAFMYFVERVEELMISRKSKALLIADHDHATAWPNVRSLAAYRESGTDWSFGREINHLVDTVHHTNSAQSRLLQLTDVYAYAMSLRAKKPSKHPRSAIVEYIEGLSDFCWPTKLKFWPPGGQS